jgi:thymidylate synthase
MKNFNKQYLSTIKTVLEAGEYLQSRNSKVLQYFSPNPITIPNVSKEFPILSVRKIPFYKSVLETFFFLSGESSYDSMPEILRNTWWKPWANKAKEQNSWGNFYGHNWRHQTTELDPNGFDQWENLIEELCAVIKTGVVNRKMCVSLWDKAGTKPEYTSKPSVLDCCHSSFLSFNLTYKWHEDELNSGYSPYQEWYLDLQHTQRSLDLMCGTGSDLIYSGLLMHLLCNEVSNRMYNVNSPEQTPVIKPRKLVFSPANTHIYEPHIKGAKQLLLLNSQLDSYSHAKISLQGPIYDFSSFKTIEDVKQVVTLKDYNPNGGNYNFELLG